MLHEKLNLMQMKNDHTSKVFELKSDLYGFGPGIITGLPTLMARLFKSSSLRKRTS